MKTTLPQPTLIRGKNNSRIALYHYADPSSSCCPVILTHGTFSNALICARLAQFLNTNELDCWVYEWSGHGRSEYGGLYPDAEEFARHDVPLVIQTVLERTGKKSCLWVAHSGGGFLPLIYLARNPGQQHKIEALVTMGSQTTGAGQTWKGKMITRLLPLVIRMLGKAPGPLFGLGPEDEVSGFLDQWSLWNRSGKWVGKDGFDYYQMMKHIEIPTLMFSGANDLIAPPNGCRRLFQSLGSTQKEYVLCARKTGFREDYTHPRFIASRNAKAEIWPKIFEFIRSQSTNIQELNHD